MVLKVETDFLMNAVTAFTNTNALLLLLPVLVSTFFIYIPIWQALNVSNDLFLLKFVSLTFPSPFSTCFFHLTSFLLLWSIAPYFLMPSPLLSFSLSAPHPTLPCLLCSFLLFLSLSLAGGLIHFIVCSLQVYPRKKTPAVDRLCVGVPAAEVSQMLLNPTSPFSSL